MSRFNRTKFLELIATSCARTAREIGLRQWSSKTGTQCYPFPEGYAVAESVRSLRQAGFLVMPEVVLHHVFTRGAAGRGSPGKKSSQGRYDLVAWDTHQTPIGIVEFKWQWNSPESDVHNLLVVRNRVQDAYVFACLMSASQDPQGPGRTLRNRVATIKNSARVGSLKWSQCVKCSAYDGGRALDGWFFQAAAFELLPKAS